MITTTTSADKSRLCSSARRALGPLDRSGFFESKELSSLTKNDKLIINPLTLTLSANSFISNINDKYSFEHEIQKIKSDLIKGELNTYAKIADNHEYLCLIQDIVDCLPSLPEIQQQKLHVPEFEEIEVLKSDTVEIKKFIRKMNLEFIGFYCNHKRNDQECDLVFKKVADIYESKEYSALVSFIENLSHCVWQIRHYDNINKKWNDDQLLPLAKDIKNLVNDLTKLAGNISKYNASMNPDCSRCKAEVRKYNYVLKEVKRMREENEEVKRMREEIDNNKEVRTPQTIKEFIVERFNGIDRFKLSEVKESYKKLFNITKTYDELTKEIENIGGYKVTNCQRILYVSKL